MIRVSAVIIWVSAAIVRDSVAIIRGSADVMGISAAIVRMSVHLVALWMLCWDAMPIGALRQAIATLIDTSRHPASGFLYSSSLDSNGLGAY